MNAQQYLEVMKKAQKTLLDYLDDEGDDLSKLNKMIEEQKIHEDQHILQSFLHVLLKIANNHHRGPNFFCKIFNVILIFKEDINRYFANSEIYNIFKSNKRILLFLIDEKMMVVDTYIAKKFTTVKKYITALYPQYFQPELMPFINEKWFLRLKQQYKIGNLFNPSFSEWIVNLDEKLPEDFEEKRRIGENESKICELIRNDSIDEFVCYCGKNGTPSDTKIYRSIYETNNFLNKNLNQSRRNQRHHVTSLIEYAAFYGAISVFKYLKNNDADMEPMIWLYAIHGNNPQLIHLLEEIIQPEVILFYMYGRTENAKSYRDCFIESIKCHHNVIAEYIIDNNLINTKKLNGYIPEIMKSYNFEYLKDDFVNESLIRYLCKYDYYIPVDILMKNKDFDINKTFTI